jgi:hypothetical protein
LKRERLGFIHNHSASKITTRGQTARATAGYKKPPHLRKFIALALESGAESISDFEIGAARAKWPLNILKMQSEKWKKVYTQT